MLNLDRQMLTRQLIDGCTARWLSAAPTGNGFFQANLDRAWQSVGPQTATLVSQSRLLYVLSVGHDRTGLASYRDAAAAGAAFLVEHFRDARHGGWFWRVDPQGQPVETYKSSYGHAFVIFGLSHAYRLTRDRRFLEAALDTLNVIDTRFASGGGVRHTLDREFARVLRGNSQNPMMHLFEALLALFEASGDAGVLDRAARLHDFMFSRMYRPQPGYMPELFDDDWRPLAPSADGHIEAGHQVEWAYLLSWFHRHRLADDLIRTGQGLIDLTLRAAFDRRQGGIFSRLDYELHPADTSRKGHWEQCELLRALARYGGDHGRDVAASFEPTWRFVQDCLIDPADGGWYGSYEPRDFPPTAPRAHKGTLWQVGYHVTGMYVELLAQAGRSA